MNLSSASFQFVVTVLGCSMQTFCQLHQPMNWLTATTPMHRAATRTCFQPIRGGDTFMHAFTRQASYD